MFPAPSQLPWFAELLGKSPSAPELAPLIAELGLIDERSGSSLWFENVEAGFSIGCRHDRIETFQFLSSEVDGFRAFAGELPLGLDFEFSRDAVLAKLGPADHETGPRSPESATGHGGILRYDLGSCWIAIVLSARRSALQSVSLESRECAMQFTGRP